MNYIHKKIPFSITEINIEIKTTATTVNLAKLTGNTCKFCKIFKNTFFTEQVQTTASEIQTLQKRKAREMDILYCREVDVKPIASA